MKLSQLTAKPQLVEVQLDDEDIISVVRTLILDENGKEILKDDAMLPTNVLMKAIGKVTEILGK